MTVPPRRRFAALLAAGSLGLVACGGATTAAGPDAPRDVAASPAADPASSPSPSPPPAVPPASDPASDAAAPTGPGFDLLDFRADAVAGGTFDGGAVRGDVVLWMWAPW